MLWKKHKPLLAVWILVLAAPFACALILAISVASEHGSRKLHPSWATALSNFRGVVVGGNTPYELLVSFGTGLVLSLSAALIVVIIAIPVARTLGTRWRRKLWIATGVAVGARVVPVTAVLPVFELGGRLFRIPNGRIFVTLLYTLLFVPLASALLATAPWERLNVNLKLLAMDSPLSTLGAVSQAAKALGPDLQITGGAVFLFAWSDFIISSFFLAPGDSTVSRLLANKQSFLGTEWGTLGAGIIVSVVPVFAAAFMISQALKARVRVSYEQT